MKERADSRCVPWRVLPAETLRRFRAHGAEYAQVETESNRLPA